jgi:glycosyltransferase involved in cell wall biosynthesis
MSPLPKISVITPSFNSLSTIRETIESVRGQGYPNLEHIVMDGGSKDGTVELLQKYSHLRWRSEKDDGHYHAMNKGIEAATGDIVAILNSDDCYRPGALKVVGEAFAEHPGWDALFGDVVFVDSNGNEIYRREEAKYDYDVLRWAGPCYVIHPALFVRKATHHRLGLFRCKDFLNVCDGEFILRLGKAGCRVGHVNYLVVNYRYHQAGQSADMRVAKNTAREWRRIREEHGARFDFAGRCVSAYYRGKRQWQKLIHRGKIDLVPGTWKLRKVMVAQTDFTSNIDMAKLNSTQG